MCFSASACVSVSVCRALRRAQNKHHPAAEPRTASRSHWFVWSHIFGYIYMLSLCTHEHANQTYCAYYATCDMYVRSPRMVCVVWIDLLQHLQFRHTHTTRALGREHSRACCWSKNIRCAPPLWRCGTRTTVDTANTVR